jgi:hypothetical protein
MANLVFPEPAPLPVHEPVPIVRIVRREPLRAIQELLAISIDHVVNDRRCKIVVADLYRTTRRVENEAWLRREIEQAEYEAWVRAHL